MDLLKYKVIFEQYPLLINANVVKKLLRIGPGKMYELLRDGRIPYIRIGADFKIPKAELIDFLYSNS